MGLLSDLYSKYGQPLINSAEQTAQGIGSAIENNVIQPAQQLGSAALNEIQAAPSQVQGVLGGVRNLLINPVEQAANDTGSFVKGIFGAPVSGFLNGVEGLGRSAGAGVQTGINYVQNPSAGIGSAYSTAIDQQNKTIPFQNFDYGRGSINSLVGSNVGNTIQDLGKQGGQFLSYGLIPGASGLVRGEGVAATGAKALLSGAQNAGLNTATTIGEGQGNDAEALKNAAKSGFAMGVTPELVSGFNPIQGAIARPVTNILAGAAAGKAEGLSNQDALLTGAFSGLHGLGNKGQAGQDVVDSAKAAANELATNGTIRRPGFIDVGATGNPPPPPSSGQVPDSFIQTAKNKGGLSDETKALLPDTFHDERNTADAVARNAALAASNPEAAAQVMKDGGDEGVFAGLALARLKGQQGDSVAQADLLKSTNTSGIEHGRAIQALSTIDASTPEGMAMIAQHEMDKVSAPQSDSITKNANDIKAAVEKSAVLTPEETTKAAQTVAERSTRPDIQTSGTAPKQSAKLPPDQATQLSKKVIAQVTPTKPKQGDILVNELTKIAKRDLPTPDKAPAQSAIDRIKQLFLMHEYDPNVYNDAKAIVQEHFKDNPDALKAISDYDKSNPSIPVDKSTLAKAVRDEIKGRGDDLKDIVKNLPPGAQKTYPDLIAWEMRNRGFSGPATDTFLESFKQEVTSQMAAKKAAAIKQMQQSGPQRSNQTFEEKLNKLNNLGVLEDSDYTDLAKAKLNLPNLNGESMKEISSRVNTINQMPEGTAKEREKTKLYNYISDQIPSSLGSKAVSLFKAGILSNPAIVAGKVLPSHILNVVAEGLTDVVASKIFDPIIGAVSGKRGTTTPMSGVVKALGKSVESSRDVALTGRTAETTPEQYIGGRTNMGNGTVGKILQAYTGFVQRMHGVIPAAGEAQAAVRNMYDQAYTAAYNKGLKGDAAERFVQDFVTNPSEKALATARYAGQRAALTNPTWSSNKIEGMINGGSDPVKGGDNVIRTVHPVVRVAAAAGTSAIDYSPLGFIKAPREAWTRAKKEGSFTPESQSLLSKGLARAAIGTGIVVAGAYAHKAGLTSNTSKDASERALKESQGIPDNSVRIPRTNKWISNTSLGPLGGPLGIGSYTHQGSEDTKKHVGTVGSAIVGGIKGLAQSQIDQPILAGFNPISDAIKNPDQKLNQFASSTAKSLIPGAVSYAASAMDPNQRVTTTDNTADSIKNNLQSAIPGLRQDLPVKNSVVGQPLANPSYLPSALSTTSPNQSDNPAVQELVRLSTTGNPATPAPLGRTLTTLGVQQNLSPQQQSDLQGIRGKAYADNMASLVQSPEYQALSDPNKAETIKKLQALVDTRTSLTYSANNPLTQTNQGGMALNDTQKNDQIKLQAANAMQQGDGKKFFDLVSTLPRTQQGSVANEIQQALGIDLPGKTNSPAQQIIDSLTPKPSGPDQRQVSSSSYLNNWDSFLRHAQFEKYNPDREPLYNLPTTTTPGSGSLSAQQVMIARSQTVDGQETELARAIKALPEYKQYANQESTWIAAHPLTPTPGTPAAAQAPQFPGEGASKADLKTYYSQMDQFNAQKLVGLGATPEEVATAQANQRIAGLAIWKSQNGIGGSSSARSAGRRVVSRIMKQPGPTIRSVGSKVVHAPSHGGTMKVSIPTRSPIKLPHALRA